MYARVSTLHAMLLTKILLADLSQVPYAPLVWNATPSANRDLLPGPVRVSGSTCHLSVLTRSDRAFTSPVASDDRETIHLITFS